MGKIANKTKILSYTPDDLSPMSKDLYQRAENLAQISPSTSILDIWRALENSIRVFAGKKAIQIPSRGGFRAILNQLLEKELISSEEHASVLALRESRNIAIHMGDNSLCQENVISYI